MAAPENSAHSKLIRSFADAVEPKFAAVMTTLTQLAVTLDGVEARVAAIENMFAGSVAAKRATVPAASAPAAAAGSKAAAAAPAAAATATDKAPNARLWFRDAFAAGAGGLRKFDTPAVREENREALKKHAPESEAYFKALGYLIWPKLSEEQKTQVKQSRAASEEHEAREDATQLSED